MACGRFSNIVEWMNIRDRLQMLKGFKRLQVIASWSTKRS